MSFGNGWLAYLVCERERDKVQARGVDLSFIIIKFLPLNKGLAVIHDGGSGHLWPTHTCGNKAQKRGDALDLMVTRHMPILLCFTNDFKRAENALVDPVYA